MDIYGISMDISDLQKMAGKWPKRNASNKKLHDLLHVFYFPAMFDETRGYHHSII